MYIKIHKVKNKKTGKTYKYLHIMKSYRVKGKVKKEHIANLGRVDELSSREIEDLIRRLRKFFRLESFTEEDLRGRRAYIIGPLMIIREVWDRLRIKEVLDDLLGKEISERVFVLVASRLCKPTSEHGLSYFLREYYVCKRGGGRWREFFKNGFEEKREGKTRVKVEWKELKRWYRSLDKLIREKEKIEVEIYRRLRDLFSMKVDVVFYDITSTYFEGRGPAGLARFGYSRDEKSNNRQVLLGIVMCDGLPIAHYVFEGNMQDKSTLEGVLKDLEKRFRLRKIIIVADRGITSLKNIESILNLGYDYILGASLRNTRFSKEILERAKNLEWHEYIEGVRYIEIREGGERWILVYSEEKKDYERRMREVWIDKGVSELERLKERVRRKNLKDERKIWYYLGKISRKYHIKRFFDFEVGEGKFRYFLSEEKLRREEEMEGKYLLRARADIPSKEVIREYKNLWEIESAFREIKDFIKIRPIYHRTEKRVKAHIFVAVLAYLVEKVIYKQIKRHKLNLSARDVINFSSNLKVLEIEVNGKIIRLLSEDISNLERKIFKIFGVKIGRVLECGGN